MTEKNPYENGVNIPDFVGKNDKDVDMSVFKLNEAENEIEEDYEDEPTRKLSPRGIMLIEAVVIAVLLIAAIGGWIFGISKSNAVKTAKAELASVQAQLTTANNDVTTLKAQNVSLQQQVTELTKAQENKNSTPTAEKTMTMTASVGVRKSAAAKSDFVKYSSLPDDLKEVCGENNGRVDIYSGAKINVYATKTDTDGNQWAQIAYNQDVWVCINYQGEVWAK